MPLTNGLVERARELVDAGTLNLDDTVNDLKFIEATEINICERAGHSFLKDLVGP